MSVFYFLLWLFHITPLVCCYEATATPFHFMNNYFINTSINKSILTQHEHFIFHAHFIGEIVCVSIRIKANSLVFICHNIYVYRIHIFAPHVSQRMLSGHRSKWENSIRFRYSILTSNIARIRGWWSAMWKRSVDHFGLH